ncbi:DUF1192 family protein [uncultured Maritalea sp.]|jgi:uncharacterized small protein (DUF1192 family)|uniref:DUF1192 family protein n=1 Tax=uncultured Maritalea sp. TaxID=757249 RepID=UPI00260E97ED|nr:DUF1192 family protein [uncultured Maritalea sp.]
MGDETIVKPVSHQVGMSLEGMPVEELDERLVMLFAEMQRVKQAIEVQRPSKADKQKEKFNSLFPMLSRPEAGQ